jgi:hypothetical protein
MPSRRVIAIVMYMGVTTCEQARALLTFSIAVSTVMLVHPSMPLLMTLVLAAGGAPQQADPLEKVEACSTVLASRGLPMGWQATGGRIALACSVCAVWGAGWFRGLSGDMLSCTGCEHIHATVILLVPASVIRKQFADLWCSLTLGRPVSRRQHPSLRRRGLFQGCDAEKTGQLRQVTGWKAQPS